MTRPNEGFDVNIYNFLEPIVPFFCKLNIHPNFITLVGLLLNLSLLGNFASHYKMIIVIISRLLDCLDGEVARKCDKQSKFGAWFDVISDLIFNTIIFMFIFGFDINLINLISLALLLFIGLAFIRGYRFSQINNNITIISIVLGYVAFIY